MDTAAKQLVGVYSRAISRLRAKMFPQELVRDQNSLKQREDWPGTREVQMNINVPLQLLDVC